MELVGVLRESVGDAGDLHGASGRRVGEGGPEGPDAGGVASAQDAQAAVETSCIAKKI